MRSRGWAALAAAVAAGCASGGAARSQSAAQLKPGASGSSEAAHAGSKASGTEYFFDAQNGFRIQRPDASWSFKPGRELSTDSIAVPLVIANAASQAQVVVQVAPAVATPSQFAQRLSTGLKSRAGFATGDVEPIPLADGAVGFDFAVGDEVRGRVAILEGKEGRVYVLLATWPQGAPGGVEREINQIFASMQIAEEKPGL